MTTITKKQAQEIIDAADAVITALAGTNDDVHPDNHTKMCQLYDELNDRYVTPEIVRELAHIALRSLDAESIAWTDNEELKDANKGYPAYLFAIDGEANKFADPRRKIMLYTAPPAQPVSEPYKLPSRVTAQDMRETFNYLMSEEEAQAAANGFNQCLLELPDVSTDTKRLNWLDAQNTRLNEYYGTSYGWRFDANFQRNAMMLNDCNFPVMTVRQAIDEAMLGSASAQDGKSASTELPNHSNLSTNSPGIPDGWKLVPIEPTEEMIVRGFESRPDESFSEPEAWEEYAAMSGCKQAAHRAKLCWAAMLAAAPTQESK